MRGSADGVSSTKGSPDHSILIASFGNGRITYKQRSTGRPGATASFGPFAVDGKRFERLTVDLVRRDDGRWRAEEADLRGEPIGRWSARIYADDPDSSLRAIRRRVLVELLALVERWWAEFGIAFQKQAAEGKLRELQERRRAYERKISFISTEERAVKRELAELKRRSVAAESSSALEELLSSSGFSAED